MQDHDLSAIGAPQSSTPVSEAKRDQALGRDEFLKLLITQLQNQDPLSPEDPSKFVSELTQFSNLEQLLGIREGVEALAAANTQERGVLDAAPLIGREILAHGSQIEVDAESRGRVAFDLPRDAHTGELRLYRGDALVSTQALDPEELGAGRHHLELAFDPAAVTPGVYRYELALTLGEEPLDAVTYVSGTATGVRASSHGDDVNVLIGSIEVPLGAAVEVRQTP